MIRSVKIIFCENDHGIGDVTFPEIGDLDTQRFIVPLNQGQLRKQAKKAGWGRVNGADYCPTCMEGM